MKKDNKTKPKSKELEKIIKGLELTYKNLIQFKKEKNSVLIVMREGKIVELQP
ncbi:MAG: hypothetical protein WC994_07170 [Brumimicrobium sp.]